MRESFGSDGQPGSYTDIDFTDCIMMVGHNMASTQTVLWYGFTLRTDESVNVDMRAGRESWIGYMELILRN
jgi:anaerobic selenocysteine-containing dehydrogenase